jgi:hypothetical protein
MSDCKDVDVFAMLVNFTLMPYGKPLRLAREQNRSC